MILHTSAPMNAPAVVRLHNGENQMAGTGEHGQRAPQTADDRFVHLCGKCSEPASWQIAACCPAVGMAAIAFGLKGLAQTLIVAAGKLRRRTVGVRSISARHSRASASRPIPAKAASLHFATVATRCLR
jgi:hypothetical protein